jgi:hypothetical protein
MEKEIITINKLENQNDNLFLVYVNPVGSSFNSANKIELIFSNNIDDCIGPLWEEICSFGVEPPRKGFIKKVIEMSTKEKKFEFIVDSDYFRMLDAVFGIVALAWEYIEDYKKMSTLNTSLIVFKYGDTYNDIIKLLNNNKIDYIVTYN